MSADRGAAELLVFRSRRRISQVAQQSEPRYTHRQADQITASFYEACRIGNLDAAGQLMRTLEFEVARSTRLSKADEREDGDDLAAVRARLQLELARSRQEAEAEA